MQTTVVNVYVKPLKTVHVSINDSFVWLCWKQRGSWIFFFYFFLFNAAISNLRFFRRTSLTYNTFPCLGCYCFVQPSDTPTNCDTQITACGSHTSWTPTQSFFLLWAFFCKMESVFTWFLYTAYWIIFCNVGTNVPLKDKFSPLFEITFKKWTQCVS